MKLLACLLLAASMALSASWDGTKGDFTVSTSERTVRVGEFDQPFMTVSVKCSNLGVSAVRVTITTHNGAFTSTESKLVELTPNHTGVATFPNTRTELLSTPPIVTALYDGPATKF